MICGAEGTRTPDPLHAMQVRYQLRHSPERIELYCTSGLVRKSASGLLSTYPQVVRGVVHMLAYLPFAAWLGLLIFALLDIDRSPPAAVRGLSPQMWLLVVVLVPIIGSVAWIAVGRPIPVHAHTAVARDRPSSPSEAQSALPGEAVPPHSAESALQARLDAIDRDFDRAVDRRKARKPVGPEERCR